VGDHAGRSGGALGRTRRMLRASGVTTSGAPGRGVSVLDVA
jgi:hypothetical protein